MKGSDLLKTIMNADKTIALVAHDNKKDEMVQWAVDNREILKYHHLCGTGTTARLVAEATHLPVKAYRSGPLGGDQQVGARITEGEIDMLIFFSDPLEAQPHDPDIKALTRISTLYDIPMANNKATADFLLTSKFMDTPYEHSTIDSQKMVQERAKELSKLTD